MLVNRALWADRFCLPIWLQIGRLVRKSSSADMLSPRTYLPLKMSTSFSWAAVLIVHGMRVLGYFCVSLAVVLISIVVYTYYSALLPASFPSIYNHDVSRWIAATPLDSSQSAISYSNLQIFVTTFAYYFHQTIAIWLIINVAFNYFKSITVTSYFPHVEVATLPNPGGLESANGTITVQVQVDSVDEDQPITWCHRCQQPKVARAHHCSVCDKCVAKMDHHCPWIVNCVGHNNHRYFLLFGLYLLIGCLYVLGFVFICMMYPSPWTKPFLRRQTTTLTGILALAMSVALLILFSFQAVLVATGQTTIEYHRNRSMTAAMAKNGEKFVNIFDLGWRENIVVFLNICDKYPWWLAFLPIAVPPAQNGNLFITRNNRQLFRQRQSNHVL